MDYKIVWSESAIADLHDICSYIVSFTSDRPIRGSHGPLREIVFRSYRIFYEVSEELRQVQVLDVWHGARDEPVFQTAEESGCTEPGDSTLVPGQTPVAPGR